MRWLREHRCLFLVPGNRRKERRGPFKFVFWPIMVKFSTQEEDCKTDSVVPLFLLILLVQAKLNREHK